MSTGLSASLFSFLFATLLLYFRTNQVLCPATCLMAISIGLSTFLASRLIAINVLPWNRSRVLVPQLAFSLMQLFYPELSRVVLCM